MTHLAHLTRIMYMSTLSLAEARAQLSRLVDSAVTTHERFEITRNGTRAAVLLSAEDYDALVETLKILGDRDLVEDVRTSLDELSTGEGTSLDAVRDEMIASGRLRR